MGFTPVRALLLALLVSLGATATHDPTTIISRLHVRIPMRDGVQLSANVFRPSQPARVPAILVRTPYNKGTELIPNFLAFVNHGYAVVVQDVRGRYESQGTFELFRQEQPDGDDTLNWIAGQPWSDGKIGMLGGSYLGIVQWKAALTNNAHLKAICPAVSGSDDYRDRFYSPGGALRLGHRLLWMAQNLRAPGYQTPDFSRYVLTLPLRMADRAATGQRSPMFQQALNHPADDAFWQSISTRKQIERIRVPVFTIGGWYDGFVESDLEAFSALQKRSGAHHILIGPWPHNMSIRFPGVEFGPESTVPIRRLQFEWFDQWLKGKDTPLLSRPPVRIFVMGINRWREEQEWPLQRARMAPFYFEGGGHANTLSGDGRLGVKPAKHEPPDQYVYDPRNPAPTAGGAVCCTPKIFPWGPMDQRPVERRRDVLVFSSEPLVTDIEVTGPVRVVLYASTTAPDTDFTAKLVDVFPDGVARNLTDGILRLRYRKSLEKPELAEPGKVYKLTIDAGVTSNVFLKGHRIRLEISSSNFPRFDRNPNTGAPVADETRLRKALQTIYHDKERPSHVLLPVV